MHLQKVAKIKQNALVFVIFSPSVSKASLRRLFFNIFNLTPDIFNKNYRKTKHSSGK